MRLVIIVIKAELQKPMASAEQQHGAAPGIGFRVEDEQAVDGAGPPVGFLGAGAFQREGVVFDAGAARVLRSGTTFCAPTIQIARAAPPA